MNPQTGDILAMVTYPNFNLNQPFTPNEASYDYWNSLNPGERNHVLYEMWRNTAVQSTFEPGSTFKFITAAAALEEGITSPHTSGAFFCRGYEIINDVQVNCHRHLDPHGHQSLTEAFGGSCNPAFMQMARNLGAPTLYRYFEAFGLFNRTTTNLYGESNSIFHNPNTVMPIELATMSFGQRINITPLQLITAVSAIANEGVLMEPNIIRQIRNPNNGN
ncbi:MAG: penicillin-binding transpeptidase domain-containing protein, partial [Oscillospiraceae bacterium]|nr:penicillin-binding transpeptidase domain-containing protein [Oscillospiraceae bacterium]